MKLRMVLLLFLYAFRFNLYCGGFILFCNVCMTGFCNVWVFLVICILYSD